MELINFLHAVEGLKLFLQFTVPSGISMSTDLGKDL